MTLIRWNPTAPRFQNDIDRLFDGFFSNPPLRSDRAGFAPPVDIDESTEAYVLRLDLPGVGLGDVKVSLIGDTLTIRGERKDETASESGNRRRTERVYGVFERTFTLGTPVHGDGVKAQYKDGVLEITVPKAETAKPREVEIQVG